MPAFVFAARDAASPVISLHSHARTHTHRTGARDARAAYRLSVFVCMCMLVRWRLERRAQEEELPLSSRADLSRLDAGLRVASSGKHPRFTLMEKEGGRWVQAVSPLIEVSAGKSPSPAVHLLLFLPSSSRSLLPLFTLSPQTHLPFSCLSFPGIIDARNAFLSRR